MLNQEGQSCDPKEEQMSEQNSSGRDHSYFSALLASRTRFCKHEGSCCINVVKGLLKGATIGLSIKGSISLLIKLIKTRDLVKSMKGVLTKDTARFGLFFALLPSLYKLFLCILRAKRNTDDKYNSIIAGIISSLAAFLDQNSGRRKLFIYYFFARAFYSAVMMMKHHQVAPIPNNWGLLIYVFMSNVLSFWIFYDWDVVPRSLYNIASKRAGFSYNDRLMVEFVFREKGKL
ncbi:unnamed protein product [Moneuplotes crassus]|uniref:Peroxisomal membrane protein 4 n=1 Tax=Euplotes crassus TaxID=5936 RepID=A0AAD2D1Y3_EUPCR|nr:unnamed protein product [Moneuplotes crassus]